MLEQLTTGSDGYSNVYKENDLDKDTEKTRTLWCKEVKAPDGYVIPSTNKAYSLTFNMTKFDELYAKDMRL